MKHLRLRRPLPLSGVALETAALGILLQNYADIFPSFCGVLATVFLSLVLLIYLCFPANIQEGRERSGTCRRCSTFTMAMMILSTFLEPYSNSATLGMWLAAILLHGVLMMNYTLRFVRNARLQNVLANYIVYVGIAAAAVTAPVFGQPEIATVAFWIGFAAFLIVLIPVTVRYVRLPEVPNPVKPLICIYAIPASLCLTAHTETVTPVSLDF